MDNNVDFNDRAVLNKFAEVLQIVFFECIRATAEGVMTDTVIGDRWLGGNPSKSPFIM